MCRILGEPWFVALQHPNFTAEMQPLLSLEKPAYDPSIHHITDAELSKTWINSDKPITEPRTLSKPRQVGAPTPSFDMNLEPVIALAGELIQFFDNLFTNISRCIVNEYHGYWGSTIGMRQC